MSRQFAPSGQEMREIDGIQVLAKKVNADNPKELRGMLDNLKNQIKSGVIVLGAEADGKAMFICGVSEDLSDRFHAGEIIKALAATVGGTGGGRPDMAQGGGPNGERISEALESIFAMVAE